MITPLEQYPDLAKAVGVKILALKREDLHPLGSHKGRSIPHMIDHYEVEGENKFAISSSGNAALAAALYVKKLNKAKSKDGATDLDVFIGMHIDPKKSEKLKALADDHIRVMPKERPLQALNEATKAGDRSLRQSVDDVALDGYLSLAEEIGMVEGVGAVFVGTSSGTTAQALAQYFVSKQLPIQVHIVQTSTCHPMAEWFEKYNGPEETSTAGAIVDKVAHRKDKVITTTEKTGGRGWIVTNSDLASAVELVKKHAHLDISSNGALAVAGATEAAKRGHHIHGGVVCIIGGE